ncbi:YidB family protein [Occallatibacter savannae]|uniref:YidB family protein n=1 Tax=Occallatibacter savannae TaxID=1002691 RepID=UPI000D68B164|nr:YidB family protein [Occallatibacter savannae]
MSIFDSVSNMVNQAAGSGDHAAVAGGLLEHLGGAGGVASLIQSMHQNGAGGLVQQWANGQTQPADPNAIQQAVGGSGLIDSIAQRTGMSPDAVKIGLATVLPLVVSHLTSNGHVTTDGQLTGNPAPATGSLLQSVLGKLL